MVGSSGEKLIKDKATSFTSRYPWIGIILILAVTFGSIAAMVLKPMESSFETEDFLPDMEVAKANTLYSERFTTSYTFMALIREDGSDLITPESFIEIIDLSDAIHESDTYQTHRDTGSQDDYPVTPASAMHDMYETTISLDNIKEKGDLLSLLIDPTDQMVSDLDELDELLENDDPLESEISNITSEIIDEIDEFIEDSQHDGIGDAVPLSRNEYYLSFTDTSSFHQEIGRLLAYDPQDSEIENATVSSMEFEESSTEALTTISTSMDVIDELISTGNLSANLTDHLSDLKGDLDLLEERLKELSSIAESSGNLLQVGQLTQSFYLGQYTFTNFFTKDFDPESGEFSAKGTMMIVSMDTSLYDLGEEDPDVLMDIEKNLSDIIKDADDGSELSMHPLAFAIINEKINEASNESMQILLPLALLFVLVILFAIYRNFFDIALNIIALLFAIIWMYGFGSIMGYSSNPMITAVPVLLVGLGIDYGIHLTMRYREEIRKGKKVKEALKAMSGSVGMALFLATFTTVFAFLSNIASPIGLIMQFGVMAAVGILASFVIMLTFVPSVKRLVDFRRASRGKTLFRKIREGECDICDIEKENTKVVNRAILGMTVRAEKHPFVILFVVGLVTMGMLAAGSQSEVTFDINDFLPDDLQESKDISYLVNEFSLSGGGETGIIVVEGDISDPGVLRSMSDSMDVALSINSEYILTEGTGKSERPKADFILYAMKDTVNQLSAVDPENAFISNYSISFDTSTGLPLANSTSSDIKGVLEMFYQEFPSLAKKVLYREDGEFTTAAIAFTVVTDDDSEAWKLYDELKDIDDPIEEQEGSGVEKVSATGGSILTAVIISSIQESQINSLFLTIVVSLIVLTIVFYIEEKSLVLGSVAVLPVVLCVIWILGTMYLVGIPLNVMTITIGSLTVGLGITYGIHITHRFLEDIRNDEDLLEASKKTILNTGSALFGAALTTVGGFGLLSFATMPPLQQFGQVTALAIIYSFISSIIVLPVLLIIWAKSRRKWRSRKRKGASGTS
jgi:predicted RND superfamily exporter protein